MNRLDDALRGGQKMCSANVATATVEAWIFQNVIFQHVIFLIGFEKTLNGESSALPGGNRTEANVATETVEAWFFFQKMDCKKR